MRAPVLGGNFGVWGGLFSTFDCAVKGVRRKEDPYNAIIAGFFTGGALAIRGGYKAARNGAIGCAVLLAVIEGVGISFQKMMAGSTKLEVSIVLWHGVYNSRLTWIGSTTAAADAGVESSATLGLEGTDRPDEPSETLNSSLLRPLPGLFVPIRKDTDRDPITLSHREAAFDVS